MEVAARAARWESAMGANIFANFLFLLAQRTVVSAFQNVYTPMGNNSVFSDPRRYVFRNDAKGTGRKIGSLRSGIVENIIFRPTVLVKISNELPTFAILLVKLAAFSRSLILSPVPIFGPRTDPKLPAPSGLAHTIKRETHQADSKNR